MESKSAQRIYKTIMLIIIVIITTSLITAFATYQYLRNNVLAIRKGNNTSFEGLEYTLSQFRTELENKYIGEINDEELIDGALKGYVNALGDPYTTYYTKEEMKEIMEETNGNFVGIGIYMTENIKENVIMVIKPIENSPAEKAGILPGDIITKINDVEYTGENMTAAANNIKGAEGTKVKLEIQRGQEIKTFEITRKKITTNPVIAEKLDNNIGYLEVTSFDENTAENFKSKYEELKAQGIDSLIIDLRNNGGGLVEEALKIADYIVPKGKELLVTVDKDGKEKVEKSKEDVLIDMPIVVLVNKNSASSSEILAGALKDLNEATIVGTTTYGKGVIQQFLTLRDGSGLKVTVEEYYTPNRTKINGVGIEPNEKIELPETITNPLTVERKDDTQLQKAIELLKK